MKLAAVGFCILLCACAQLTGIADLSVGEKASPSTPDDDSGTPIDESDTGPRADGSPGTKDATTDTTPIDTGADTTPTTCTALPTNETFPAAPGMTWNVLGNASAAMPGVRLTPSAGGMSGALWWNTSFMFERFEITFSYVITTDPASTTYGPGDGLTFAWVASATPPALSTSGGGGMAVQGLTGWAVAVDAYQNPEFTDPPTPNIAIKNTVDMTTVAATAANAALIDGNAHAIKVRLVSGQVTVSLDGAVVLGPTALPAYTAFDGYFGFGAGTGGAFEDHKITSVTARIGATGNCAAP